MSSKGSYLPKRATIDEATQWLEEATGESWPLGRLLDHGRFLRMGVWLRPDERTPPEVLRDVFEGRGEGFWAPLCFASDVAALAADRTLVITLTRTASGKFVETKPGMMFPLDDLRIEGDSLRLMVESLKPEHMHITTWVKVPKGATEFEYWLLGELLADASASPNEHPVIEATRGIHFQGELDKRVKATLTTLRDSSTGAPIAIGDDQATEGATISLDDFRKLLAEPIVFGSEVFRFGLLVEGSTDTAPKGKSQAQATPDKRQRFEIHPRVAQVPRDLLKLGRDTEVLYDYVGRPGMSCGGAGKAFQLVELLEEISARQAKGRYTLAEAAAIFAEEEGEDTEVFLTKFKTAAMDKSLTVHLPQRTGKHHVPVGPLVLCDETRLEARWDKLNAWLDEHEDVTVYRFPAPIGPATTTSPASERESDSAPSTALKRAALVAALKHEWPGIDEHLDEASRNGLKVAAHTGKHGMWNLEKARAWGMSKGHIAQPTFADPLQTAWMGPAKTHRIQG